MLHSKEEIENYHNKLHEMKEKVKSENAMTFISLCSLIFGDIEDIIERKTTDGEKNFYVENFNSKIKDPDELISSNKRIMKMFIEKFLMNDEKILKKLNSNLFTSDN
ncbi:999_t:CDS:1 [Cetraspora pellucida]|uniref:999_t:CDS:1 n=1 Tax=Cetraspora pellucida TaxID=1433469 RepID=A0ACA9PH11_9GLOM|nr:999_t:CDS:1 [Cetraspora pellucida]